MAPHTIHWRTVNPETLGTCTCSRTLKRSETAKGSTTATITTFTSRPSSVTNLEEIFAIEIRTERLRDHHAPVCALVRLQETDESPRQRHAGAVERVNVGNLPGLRLPVADVGAPGLERFKVAATRHLEELAQARRPGFEIVTFRGGESEVSGRKAHDPVVQTEALEDRLGVLDEPLKLLVRGLRPRELDELHLVKLVHPDEPLRLLPVRSRLAAETRSIGGV